MPDTIAQVLQPPPSTQQVQSLMSAVPPNAATQALSSTMPNNYSLRARANASAYANMAQTNLDREAAAIQAQNQDRDITMMQKNFRRNQYFMADSSIGNFNTQLTPQEEQQFRQWVVANKVPFDPNQSVQDYDMRGFWKALMQGDPKAKSAIDPNDNRLHYPDYWKTPYHESFSNESQWASPTKAPRWNEKDQLVLPDGTVIFDDRAQKK